ncbi:hypothetical protein GGR57DRAFT_115608 [Xylariaceae sp. FL1272]|nr:hypothetical protein GGR57DRAFT_115608 [Xylariaceae sp. FL1272]
MAETITIIGLVASVGSLCKAILGTISIACEIHQAPEELHQLKNQIQGFQSVVNHLANTPSRSFSGTLELPIANADRIVTELSQLLNIKAVQDGEHSATAVRLHWSRNIRKISALRRRLQATQDSLTLALNTEVLSSNWQMQSTLEIMQTTATKPTVHQMPQAYRNQGDPARPCHPILPFGLQQKTPQILRSFVLASNHAEEVPDSTHYHPPEATLLKEVTHRRNSQKLDFPSIASVLELSPFFLPELYTSTKALKLIHYNYHQIESTNHTQTNHCILLYSQAPRQWTRLTVSVTTIVTSSYWRVNDGVRSLTLPQQGSHGLPKQISSSLLTFLHGKGSIHKDAHLDLLWDDKGPAQATIRIRRPSFDVRSYLVQATQFIHHWNCPRYCERELSRQPLLSNQPRYEFKVFLEGRWVCELKFGSTKAHIDALIYVMQFSHFSRGVPGVSPFLGLVMDESNVLSGFLMELPAKGHLNKVTRSGPGKPNWKRREKWCRQIIQAVADVHSRGLVIGSLAELPCVVAVDGYDNAVLFRRFQTTLLNKTRHCGEIPPECRAEAIHGNEIKASPAGDIFQLGLLLWRVIALDFGFSHSFCKAVGCSQASLECTKPHADPVQLPPLESCPSYLVNIITACRVANPDERLPAWQLLELYDPEIVEELVKMEIFDQGSHPKRLRRVEDCEELYHITRQCNVCRAETTGHSFKCTTCDAGDFDMCPSCFARGVHCYDAAHYLREHSTETTRDKFYSAVKLNGEREVIVV